jgi:hypothetical protein
VVVVVVVGVVIIMTLMDQVVLALQIKVMQVEVILQTEVKLLVLAGAAAVREVRAVQVIKVVREV